MTTLQDLLLFFSPDNAVNGALVLIGTLLGIPYVYLQYKASPKFWFASLLNALPFIYVNFVQGNFATAGLFTYYFLVAVQAIFFKKDEVTEEGVFQIYQVPRTKLLPLAGVSVVLLVAFYLFLANVQTLLGTTVLGIAVAVPQTPLIDAFATAFSCVGMWLIAHKYFENWLIWIVVNVGYVVMYLVQANYFWAGLFFLYLVMSVVGWLEWRKLFLQQQQRVVLSAHHVPTEGTPIAQQQATSAASTTTTVILASGLFPRTERVLEYLRKADFIACCDGAANACVAAGFTPDVIVGDGDSIAPEVLQRFADRVVRIPEQETNDLTKTFHHCLHLGRKDQFIILGATGKREDHALANLALLMDYAEEHEQVIMVSDFGTFYPCRDQKRLTVEQGQEVSIMNFGASYFSGEGLMYPLYDFTKLWQGTLNVATRPDVAVHAKGTFLLYVAEKD